MDFLSILFSLVNSILVNIKMRTYFIFQDQIYACSTEVVLLKIIYWRKFTLNPNYKATVYLYFHALYIYFHKVSFLLLRFHIFQLYFTNYYSFQHLLLI